MKNVLCFGDSNTWGYIPGLRTRYAADVRWPGVAKSILSSEYNIYEHAISGRLTVSEDPYHRYWNGREALGYALLSTYPLDLVVLMLGTNDLKYGTAENAARGVEVLVKDILQATSKCDSFTPIFENEPKVLLVAPPTLNPEIKKINPSSDLREGYEESARFAALYKVVAETHGVAFLDASEYAEVSSIDGIHLTEEGHKALGMAIAEKIKTII